jgi:tetratricopeptide (TPR) repeat protein
MDTNNVDRTQSISELLTYVKSNDLANCEKVCLDLLRHEHNSTEQQLRADLQKIYCRSLISSSKFHEMIEYCTSLSQDAKGQNEVKNLILERSYALYKLGRYTDCRNVVSKELTDENKPEDWNVFLGLQHLLAQSLYHLHQSSMSVMAYQELMTISDEDDDSEILTNIMAALVSNVSIPIPSELALSKGDLIEKELLMVRKNGSDYPYEMAYNYATYQLLTSNSVNETKKAMELLSIALEECKSQMEEEEDKIVKAKNMMPIQANMALGQIQSGDWNSAVRTYIELNLASQKLLEINPEFNAAGALLVAGNNLATVSSRKGNSSADLLHKLPDISFDAIDCKKSGVQKTTPNQIRIILFNRALLLHKMSKSSEAKAVLSCLRASVDSKTMDHGGKKKKHKAASVGLFDASPCTDDEKLAWEVRISLLEAEINRNDVIFSELESLLTEVLREKESLILEYSLAELKLYQCQKELQSHENRKKMSPEDVEKSMIAVLESLPKSISRRPAIIATLCSLYGSLGMESKMEDFLMNAVETSQKSVADYKLRLGQYEDAAAMYKNILHLKEQGSIALTNDEFMECTAGLVKALSHFDIDSAIEISTQFNVDYDSIDGDELEAMEVPRLSKSSSNVRKTALRSDTV